jgi:cytochrome b561
MRFGIAEGLFWAAIALIAASFVLGGFGTEISSDRYSVALLQWHKAFGLLSLILWLAAALAAASTKRRFSAPLRFWAARLRGPILALLFLLVVLQPVSGWLLASLQGKLTSIFGWQLPAITSPSKILTEYVLAYHVFSAGLIMIIAAWSLGLIWEGYALGSLMRLSRRRLMKREKSDQPRTGSRMRLPTDVS